MKQSIDDILVYVRNLFNHPLLKAAGAETIILTQAYTDAKLAIFTVICLVIMDTILGMAVAGKFGNLSSWRFRKAIYKLLFYLIVIFLGSLSYVMWGIPWIHEAFVGLIISTEIISILENTETCFPGTIPRNICVHLKLAIHRKRKKHCK